MYFRRPALFAAQDVLGNHAGLVDGLMGNIAPDKGDMPVESADDCEVRNLLQPRQYFLSTAAHALQVLSAAVVSGSKEFIKGNCVSGIVRIGRFLAERISKNMVERSDPGLGHEFRKR